MIKYIWGVFLLVTLASCHDKKSKPKKDLYKAETFFDEFRTLRFPYIVADTAIASRTDSSTIPADVLKKYLPDSITAKILDNNPTAHPVGKIDNATNRFILLALQKGQQTKWYVMAFDNKNKFLSYLPLINNRDEDSYRHTLSINQEPTFTIGKSKKDSKDNVLYTNEGFGYNTETHQFSLVINDSNENLPESDKIYVPIDTLAKHFPFSGDYRKDKQNVLVLRDGSRPNEYIFFYHFDKTDDDPSAKGEIKGKLRMAGESNAIYQQGGDPCVIDFNFKSNKIKIKEEGNCANYRGSNVQFDDTFSKVESSKEEKDNAKKK
ncbi:MAG: hypothetical protein DI598_12705 [Pseudopedobacter saltans]|uniref:Lipoprotein n=1 Tax=Pseudopedobacter saltans TaxID=151895 RepID=A0A2W5ERM2_9SPHI|nr:MAG: hypothetical protein DI598_12705 [Pseudopedobacter saltans]